MSTLVAYADRRLPRGVAHLCIQFIIWMAFYFAYNITRGLADRNIPEAFENGEAIARAEERLGALFEPALQQALASPLLTTLSSYTYWLSQFVIVGGALFWVYFRHHERFAFFRNWLILANMIGLVCYVLIPTAPPRMFPELGFSDTLASPRRSTTEAWAVLQTSTRRCRACTPWMPSLSAPSCSRWFVGESQKRSGLPGRYGLRSP